MATSGSPSTARNNIGMINPTTDAITEFAIPTASSKPSGIAAGPDGNLLFAESGSSRIGVVTPGTSLAVTTEPPASVTLGQSFGLTVSVDDLSGSVDTDYNGPVTVALVNTGTATLGGTLTVNATDGVATFSGLSINQSGTGYVLMASTNAQTTADTTPVAVSLTTMIVVLPPPVAPTIVAGQVLYAGKRLHKHVVGFQLDFSEALASTAAQDAANYAVTRIVKHRHKPAMKAVRLGVGHVQHRDGQRHAHARARAPSPPAAGSWPMPRRRLESPTPWANTLTGTGRAWRA